MLRTPSLAGCWLRVVRAERYIDEANNLIIAFGTECEERVLKSYDAQTGQYGKLHFPDAPKDLPLAISDAVHNLRAALDYLVYELAFKDSGAIQNGTQFPIETHKVFVTPSGNKVGFDVVVDRYLKGVSQSNRDLIETLQPYRGNTWTEILRDISNPDKHRELTPIAVGDTVAIWERKAGEGTTLPTGETIKSDATHTFRIDLPKGNGLIVSTLYTLQAHIIDAINLFHSQF